MARKTKDKGLTLSPKHGLNPAITKCFWCGKHMGVALLGRVRREGDSDAEAPREIITDLEPCPECRKHFETGVLLIEVTEDGSKFDSNERFSLGAKDGPKHLWPTGRWVVLRPEAVKDGKPGGKALCDTQTMDKILAVGHGEKA